MHHVLIVLNVTFIQGHTNFNHENKNCSSNPHHVRCEDSPTKGLYNNYVLSPVNLLFTRRSQQRLKVDKMLNLYHSSHSTESISAMTSTLGKRPVPKDAERHWDVNLILFTW